MYGINIYLKKKLKYSLCRGEDSPWLTWSIPLWLRRCPGDMTPSDWPTMSLMFVAVRTVQTLGRVYMNCLNSFQKRDTFVVLYIKFLPWVKDQECQPRPVNNYELGLIYLHTWTRFYIFFILFFFISLHVKFGFLLFFCSYTYTIRL